jgi:hypothetical protein
MIWVVLAILALNVWGALASKGSNHRPLGGA